MKTARLTILLLLVALPAFGQDAQQFREPKLTESGETLGDLLSCRICAQPPVGIEVCKIFVAAGPVGDALIDYSISDFVIPLLPGTYALSGTCLDFAGNESAQPSTKSADLDPPGSPFLLP